MRRELRLFDALDTFAAGQQLTHAIGLSFGYDGDVAYERVWKPLIEKFGVRKPIVITDGTLVGRDGPGPVNAGTALAVVTLRARRRGRGVFHPKLFLAVREDAVFVAVGSANLTSGGLGGNLELMTALAFGNVPTPSPKRVLSEVLDFLRTDVRNRILGSAASRAGFDEAVKLATVIGDATADTRDDRSLSFVHSCRTPLWEQLVAAHADDPVQRAVVLSPLYEVEDPEDENPDGLVSRLLSSEVPWAPRASNPRVHLHVGSLNAAQSVGGLPHAALSRDDHAVTLLTQNFSHEPRRLHAKLVALFGRKRTTMLWGSPNFTPAAFLRDANSESNPGNMECAMMMRARADDLSPTVLARELDLKALFRVHEGDLPPPPAHLPAPPVVFEVGELLYDPAAKTLELHAEIFDSAVDALHLQIPGEPTPLFTMPAARGEAHQTWPAAQLEEIETATNLPRLRMLQLMVAAVDGSNSVLDTITVRINVRFDDAIEVRDNYLLGANAVGADVLLVPSTAPPEQRVAEVDKRIAQLRAAVREGVHKPARHQASLDTFYRNVRRGLSARWKHLHAYRGSRFALMRWSVDLRRALTAATTDLDATRRAYLVLRTSEHVSRVVGSLADWHADVRVATSVLDREQLAEALGAVVTTDVEESIAREVDLAREHALRALRGGA